MQYPLRSLDRAFTVAEPVASRRAAAPARAAAVVHAALAALVLATVTLGAAPPSSVEALLTQVERAHRAAMPYAIDVVSRPASGPSAEASGEGLVRSGAARSTTWLHCEVHPSRGVLVDRSHPRQRSAGLAPHGMLFSPDGIFMLPRHGDATRSVGADAYPLAGVGSNIHSYFPALLHWRLDVNAAAHPGGAAARAAGEPAITLEAGLAVLTLPGTGDRFQFDPGDWAVVSYEGRDADGPMGFRVLQWQPNPVAEARLPKTLLAHVTWQGRRVETEHTYTAPRLRPDLSSDHFQWFATHTRLLDREGAFLAGEEPVEATPLLPQGNRLVADNAGGSARSSGAESDGSAVTSSPTSAAAAAESPEETRQRLANLDVRVAAPWGLGDATALGGGVLVVAGIAWRLRSMVAGL